MRKHTRIDKPFIEEFAEGFKRQARNKLIAEIMTAGKDTGWTERMIALAMTCYDGKLPENAEIEFTEEK